jgi:hypothetical protein
VPHTRALACFGRTGWGRGRGDSLVPKKKDTEPGKNNNTRPLSFSLSANEEIRKNGARIIARKICPSGQAMRGAELKISATEEATTAVPTDHGQSDMDATGQIGETSMSGTAQVAQTDTEARVATVDRIDTVDQIDMANRMRQAEEVENQRAAYFSTSREH